MGLLILILGLIVFVAAHSFVTFRAVRADAIERLGLMTYRALFALVSLIGLAIIIYGYGQYHAHELIQVWSPPAFMRHITEGLMLFAAIFFTAAFIPSHIKAKLKHPMLAGVKTWALAHLLSNGDLGAITAPAGYTNDVIVVVIGIVIYLALGYAFHPMVIGAPVFGRA